MKTYTAEALKKMAKEGRIEAQTDIKSGYVEIRWARTGKRETVTVK